LKVVATSREALHVVGEVVYHVPALAVPDARIGVTPDDLRAFPAVALFVDRASSVDRKFAMTSDNAEDISRICRELDGVPLALELAASRVRAMSVKTIAEHLDQQLRLLMGGDRSGLPRQQTLRALLDWSYNLLAEPERSLLRRMAVFSGGFEIDAAEAVGAVNDVRKDDVLYLLANLVEKSLVEFDPQGNRYRLLETVRQYALERLAEQGDEGAARDQHLAFYASMARHMRPIIRTAAQPVLVARVRSERDNIVGAFAHAATSPDGGMAGLEMVQPLLMIMPNASLELKSRLAEGALAHPGAQARDLCRARALYAASFSDLWRTRYDEALRKAEESIGIAREMSDARTLAEGLYRSACIALALHRFEVAQAQFEEMLELGGSLGDRYLVGSAHGGLGELHSVVGRLDLAQTHYLEAVACNPGEQDHNATCYSNLARNAIVLGREAQAVDYYRRALVVMDGVRNHSFIPLTLCVCAGIATMREDWVCAIRLLAASEVYLKREGMEHIDPDASVYAGRLRLAREALGEPAAAEAFASGAAMSEDEACREAAAWFATVEPRATS
jgi:predicted ATPase